MHTLKSKLTSIMKKVLSIVVVAGLVGFASCKKAEESKNETNVEAPAVEQKAEEMQQAADTTAKTEAPASTEAVPAQK